MKKLLTSILLLSFATTMVSALEGRILKNERPLAGVSVWTSATEENPSRTNRRGVFRINISPVMEDTLFVKISQEQLLEIPFSDVNLINIQITDERISIQQERREEVHPEHGGVVITRQALEDTGETNLLRAISLRASGVVYRNGSLHIRGVHTLNLNNTPLFVINGVETFSPPFMQVHDVRSVEILRDASASIFGVRGTNGVVIIRLR